ncbi:pilus assembly protein Flp/PilA [Rhodobium orientis]|nr:Flp family type IVb pilin [Rhodobium orientis]MBB4305570.1 pilus assembly protein Flp/PilA [Rhodobium orientis]
MADKTDLTVSRRQFSDLPRRFAADERGATAIEYALIAMMTGIMAVGAMTALGDVVSGSFFDVVADLFPDSP